MNVFFFGLGYSSRAAARWLRELAGPGIAISGTVRDPGKAEALRREGYEVHRFDGTVAADATGAAIRAASHIVVSIPPGDADPVLTHHRGDLDAADGLEWIGYYSTVGVYGDAGGAWIDETAQTRPVNPRSVARVQAENAWRDYAGTRGVPLAILRIAGIYGPGRSAFDRLRAGTARRIIKPGQVFNRIHVEDIGRLTALAALQKLGGTFNLADDEPSPPQDLVAHAAALIGTRAPADTPFEKAELAPMARSFYSDNKRCSNTAIKTALEVELLYPTYREGLAAILEAEAA